MVFKALCLVKCVLILDILSQQPRLKFCNTGQFHFGTCIGLSELQYLKSTRQENDWHQKILKLEFRKRMKSELPGSTSDILNYPFLFEQTSAIKFSLHCSFPINLPMVQYLVRRTA